MRHLHVDLDRQFEQLELQLMRATLGIAALGSTAAYWVSISQYSWLYHVTLPFLLMAWLVLSVVVWQAPKTYPIIKHIYLGTTVLYLLICLNGFFEQSTAQPLFLAFSLWFPVQYMVIYVLYPSNLAHRLALGLLVLSLCSLVAHLGALSKIDPSQLAWLIHFYVASVVTIMMSRYVILIKDKYVLAYREANSDALTGLYNRRYLEDQLNEVVSYAVRYDKTVSILLLDLDHFKQINDLFGHATGDIILKGFAEVLHLHLPKNAIAGRWGGEEFLVILPEMDLHRAWQVAEYIHVVMRSIKFKKVGSVTISVGVSELASLDSIQTLIQRADQALYQAKGAGRNKTMPQLHDIQRSGLFPHTKPTKTLN